MSARFSHVMVTCFLCATSAPAQPKVDSNGDPLPDGAIARLGTVRVRQHDFVRVLLFSPDGKTLASGGDHTSRLWEVPSGKPLKKFPTYPSKEENAESFHTVHALAFAPSGKLLAANGHELKHVLYEAETGKKLHEAKGTIDALSADGKIIAGRHDRGTIVRNLETGKASEEILGSELFGSAISPDGKLFAAASGLGLSVWDAETGKHRHNVAFGRGYFSAAFSTDAKTLVGTAGTTIGFWDTGTGKHLRLLKYAKQASPIALSPDDKTLAVGTMLLTYAGGRSITLLDAATGKELPGASGHKGAVIFMEFASGGKELVTADEHGSVRTWDLATGKQTAERSLPVELLQSVAYCATTGLLAWTDRGRVHLWDLATGKEVRAFRDDAFQIIHVSPDGKYLAGWTPSNKFRVRDVDSGKELPHIQAKEIEAVGFLPDSKSVAVGKRGTLRQLDLQTGKQLRTFSIPAHLTGPLDIPAEPKFLAASDHGQKVMVWDMTEAKDRGWTVQHPTLPMGPRTTLSGQVTVALSPDGKVVASGGYDHTVRLWDAATGKELGKLTGHQGNVERLIFSADGKRLISASADTTVLVWDISKK